MAAGYVYIMTNPSHVGLLKIGKTTRTPEARARELGTGVPTPFEVAYSEHVSDCGKAERRIHTRLAGCRISVKKEFFKVDLDVAIEVVRQIAAQQRPPTPIPSRVPVAPRPIPLPIPPRSATPPPLPALPPEPSLGPPEEKPVNYRPFLYLLGAAQLVTAVIVAAASLDRSSQLTVLAVLGFVGLLAAVATCVAAVKGCSWSEALKHTAQGLGAVAAAGFVVFLALNSSGGAGRRRRGVSFPRRRSFSLPRRRRRW